jgi:hypothetical protein
MASRALLSSERGYTSGVESMLLDFPLDMMLKHPRFMDPFEGHHLVYAMEWFMKKVWNMLECILLPADNGGQGQKLREEEHLTLKYYMTWAVTDGGVDEFDVLLYSFDSERDRPPPKYEDHGEY